MPHIRRCDGDVALTAGRVLPDVHAHSARRARRDAAHDRYDRGRGPRGAARYAAGARDPASGRMRRAMTSRCVTRRSRWPDEAHAGCCAAVCWASHSCPSGDGPDGWPSWVSPSRTGPCTRSCSGRRHATGSSSTHSPASPWAHPPPRWVPGAPARAHDGGCGHTRPRDGRSPTCLDHHGDVAFVGDPDNRRSPPRPRPSVSRR